MDLLPWRWMDFLLRLPKGWGQRTFARKLTPQWKLRRRISEGLVPASIGAHRPGFIKLPVIWIQGMECQPTAWSMSIGSNLCMNNCKYYWSYQNYNRSILIRIFIVFFKMSIMLLCRTLKSTLQTARPLLSVAIVGPCLSGLRRAFDWASLTKWS